MQYPDGDLATWSYDAGGQPYGLGGGGEALVLSSSYRPWGALDRQQLGNGLALDDDYEEAERLWLTRRQVAALDAQGNLVNPLLDLSYDYDPVGNVLAITDTLTSEVHGYLYDQRDRLTEWRLNGAVQQGYTYNEIGNIASFAGVTYSYPAPGQGRPHAVTGTSAGGSFSYDNAGYMASRRDRAGAVNWTYTWRENHKLGQISSSATDDVATFLYGPDDERIKKSSGPAGDTYDTYYLFPFYQVENGCLRADIDCDGDVDVLDIQKVASRWNTAYPPFEQDGVAPITTVDLTLVAEKWLWTGGSNTGQVVKTYSLGGRTVAVKRGGEWTYLFQDHLGSPTLETDYDGNPGFRWKYEPYGTMRGTEWTLPIDRAFTGQVIEPGLGLHDYVARHYAQPLGRWIAPDTIVPDPADPQSLNRYSYVGNNPLRYVDPSGHQIELPNPFEWLARLLGFGGAKKVEAIPAYRSLTVDVGETYYETLDTTSGVLGGAADTGLGLVPGGGAFYDAYTAASGQNILGEDQSPAMRGLLVFGLFTPIDEIIPVARNAAIVGKTEAHHWIPQALHEQVRKLYPGVNQQMLGFTDPLADDFHKVLHGKSGTIADAYNDSMRQWLDRFGTTKTGKEFLEFVKQQREEYLRLYQQYLTGG